MNKELVLKKCKSCGAIVKVIEDCNCPGCGIRCCDEEMEIVVPNSVECAVEKHIPSYEKEDDKIKVRVNHVMEEEHYIEWILLVSDEKECMVKLRPGQSAEATFKYIKGSTVYAYCNKHGLWKVNID